MAKATRRRQTWAVAPLLLVLWLTACTEITPDQAATDSPSETPAHSPVPATPPTEVPFGTWSAHDDSNVFLTLEEAGTLTGYDGCNTVGGTWTVEQDNVTVTLGNVTEKLCPDIDTWLLDARAVARDGDALVVFDESGTMIGRLAGEE